MSTDTKPSTPLTMSAEREAVLRDNVDAIFDDDLVELLAELDASRAAHAETQERLADALRTKGGHKQPCYYCGENCNSLAANPGKWPIPLCHPDDPGKVKWHHIGCVSERLEQLAEAQRDTERLDWLEAQKDNGSYELYAGGPWRYFSHERPAVGQWKIDGNPEFGKHETAREAIDSVMEANTKALRTKPDALRPAESDASDAAGSEGGHE